MVVHLIERRLELFERLGESKMFQKLALLEKLDE